MSLRLRILHVSDLHERVALDWMSPERKRKIAVMAASRHRVLDESNFLDTLRELRRAAVIDLVCMTGDLADWGLPAEYSVATRRIDAILEAAGASRDQLFLVPGNHDIVRSERQDAWKELRNLFAENPVGGGRWLAGLKVPAGANPEWPAAIGSREQPFWRWVAEDLGRSALLPANHLHGKLGYRATLRIQRLPFPIHVCGLDSAWLAGDEGDARKLRLTDEQIDLHARDAGKPLDGFRLALLHHPLSDLADERSAFARLASAVDLVLHGHQHDPVSEVRQDPDRKLYVFAAGSLYEGDEGDRWVNSFQLVDVTLDDNGRPQRYQVHFRGWSERGHWYPSGAIYKAAPNGTLTIDLQGAMPDAAPGLPDPLWYRVPRQRTFDSIKQALCASEVRVLALVGMSGVGKSTLAIELAQDGEVRRAFPGGVFWITIGQERAAVMPQIRHVMIACGESNPLLTDPDAALRRLNEVLHSRSALLVLDDVWEASDAAKFANVGKSKVLMTTRDWTVGDAAGARRFSLEPLEINEALLLFEKRLGNPLLDAQREQAAKVAEAVGRLPISLAAACARIEEGDTWIGLLAELQDEVRRLIALQSPQLRAGSQLALNTAAALELSIRKLPPDVAANFAALSLLAEDAEFSGEVAANLWDVASDFADASLRELRRKELLQHRGNASSGRRLYALHDQQRDAGRRQLGLSPAQAHLELIERYRKVKPRLSRIEDDGYVHDHLVWHLSQTGSAKELHELLADEDGDQNAWFASRGARIGGYLDDVQTALQASQGMLSRHIRYIAILGSVGSLSSSVPIAVVTELLKRKLWSEERVFDHAFALPKAKRGGVIADLIGLLDDPLRGRCFDAVMEEVAELDGERRVWLLSSIPPVIDNDQMDRMLAIAHQRDREQPLPIIVSLRQFARVGRWDVVFGEIDGLKQRTSLGSYYSMPWTVPRLFVSARLLENFDAGAIERVLKEFPAEPELCAHAAERLCILGDTNRALQLALTHPHALQNCVVSVAPYLRDKQMDDAISLAYKVENDYWRVKTLGALLAQLPEPLRHEKIAELYRQTESKRRSALIPYLPANILSRMEPPEDNVGRDHLLARLMKVNCLERALAIIGRMDSANSSELEIVAPALDESQLIQIGVTDPDCNPLLLAAMLPRWVQLQPGVDLREYLARLVANQYVLSNCVSALAPLIDDQSLRLVLDFCQSINDEKQCMRCQFAVATQAPDVLKEALLDFPVEDYFSHDEVHLLARTLTQPMRLALRDRLTTPPFRLAVETADETWLDDVTLSDIEALEAFIQNKFDEVKGEPLMLWGEVYREMRGTMDYLALAVAHCPESLRLPVVLAARSSLSHFGVGAPKACLAFYQPSAIVAAVQTEDMSISSFAALAAGLPAAERVAVEKVISRELAKVGAYQTMEQLSDSESLSPAMLDLAFENATRDPSEEYGLTGVALIEHLAQANRVGDALKILSMIPLRRDDSRMKALVALATKLPPPGGAQYLGEAWSALLVMAVSINRDSNDAGLLASLVRVLLKQPIAQKRECLAHALEAFSKLKRADLFDYLAACAPLIRDLGGEGEIAEVHRAIGDVSRWWP